MHGSAVAILSLGAIVLAWFQTDPSSGAGVSDALGSARDDL